MALPEHDAIRNMCGATGVASGGKRGERFEEEATARAPPAVHAGIAARQPRWSPTNPQTISAMFLNLDIKPVRTGIENAALLRAGLFERNLGLVPQILTVDYNPYFAETRAELIRRGIVSSQTVFRNLYDDFQEFDPRSEDVTTVGFPMNPKWEYRWVPGTPDVRIYDEGGQLLMYKKCSRSSGALEYINLFHRGKMWRRDTYTAGGVLSRIQHLDPNTRAALFECYLRPDGSVAMTHWYTNDGRRRELSKISLTSREGFCTHDFRSKAAFIAHWIDRLTDDPDRRYLMVCDKNRVLYGPLRQVAARPRKDNLWVVPVIHAVHTKDGFDVWRSGTNINYAEILSEIHAPDAIVVATARQQADIVKRYGDANIHVIPPGFAAAERPNNVGFAARDRLRAIYVGRYSDEKNHAAAIRAFRHVVAAVPDATLDLYGDGSGKRAVVELVAQLGLGKSVFVHDYVADVTTLYRSAGVSLLTSRGEGYSLVVCESLCQGCPVIAFDVNYGPADMIRDGETGFLVPFGDEALLAARLVGLFRDPARHERMCAAALESSADFGPDSVAVKWRGLIDALQHTRNTASRRRAR